MISPRSPLHKCGAALAAVLLFNLAGCGGGSTGEQPADGSADASRVRVDDSGWTAFADLAGRITSGQPVARDELGGLGAQPAWERWRASQDQAVDLRRIANWMEAAFWQELGRSGVQKQHPARRLYAESWRWSWDHREIVASRVHETVADTAQLTALVERWIAPPHRPGTIRLTILPTRPEFRLVGDEYFVDTGFLAAMPRGRLAGELVGLMYRDREFLPGPDHRTAEGAAAVAHTFRAMRNQGVAHWIEDTPHAHFFNDHPHFAGADVITQKYWQQALRALAILEAELPAMGRDPDRLAARGRDLMTALNTIQADRNLGWAMAATIAGHLGEDRLREAGRGVPEFVAAFQEAASRNADPVPALSACGGAYHTAIPPLSDEAWAGLHRLLTEFFPG